MSRRRLSVATFAIGLWLTPTWVDSAFAERRVALVVGNSAYQNAPFLPNPTSDAQSIADNLKKGGFEVVTARSNVGIKEFLLDLRRFEEEAARADIAVLYYAGHAIEIAGMNYAIPVDAKLVSDRDVRDEAVSLERLLETVEGAKRLRLVILDACRDNPFAKTMKRQRQAVTRAVSAGLAMLEPTLNNTLVAYAAKAGAPVEDGRADHSPYTAALLTHLFVPGLDIRLALGRVRDQVVKDTNNRQEPFYLGSLGGDSISVVPAPAKPPTPSVDTQSERDNYLLAEKIGTKDAFEAFLASHPNGFLAELARRKLAALETPNAPTLPRVAPDDGKQLAAVEPSRPPPAPVQSKEQEAWEKIKDSSDAAAFRDFIRRFPSSVLAIQAKTRAEAIEEAKAAEEARLKDQREEKARAEREARLAEEARLKAERDEKARIGREAKAIEGAQRKAEREAKAAEDARLQAEREQAAMLAERQRIEKLSEAERVKAEHELELKRLDQERRAKLAEEARIRQEAAIEAARAKVDQAAAQAAQAKLDAACKREEGRLGSLQATGWRGRDDLKRLDQELTCERLRPSVLAALEKSLALPISNTPEQVRSAQVELARIGCLDGTADGILGPVTRVALNRYQAQRGGKNAVEVEITDAFLSELKSQSTGVCPLVARTVPVATPKRDEPAPRLRAKQEEDPPPRRVRQEESRPRRVREEPRREAKPEPRMRRGPDIGVGVNRGGGLSIGIGAGF